MKRRILIIDDEPDIGETLSTILEAQDCEVIIAYDGPSGLAELEKHPPDVMLLDYMLPGMDGIEILCEVRHRWPGLPVVIITAYGSSDLNIRANKFSVIEVVSKPFDIDYLLRVLDKIGK